MTFSIIIPVFNGELFLEETIKSVLNQKRKANEIIVYDDGSQDNTGTIVKKFKNKIKYIRNEQGPSGFVNAWNNSIYLSTCDFISILHQDDLLLPDFLFEAERILKLDMSVKHFFCICDYINHEGKILNNLCYSLQFSHDFDVVSYSGLEYMISYQKQYGNSLHIHRCPGVITHRSIFFDLNCWYNPLAGHIADDDFFLRVGFLTDVKGFLKPLAHYRIHEASETSSIGDFNLVTRLANDYLFQVKQWSLNNSIGHIQKKYFYNNFFKYNNRLLVYSFKYRSFKSLKNVISNYFKLFFK
jgi:glycosyltransferase involved in cell wall biosynthesis